MQAENTKLEKEIQDGRAKDVPLNKNVAEAIG